MTATGVGELHSVNETAAILKVCPQTVYRAIRSGRLHSVKAGAFHRISDQDIREYLQASKNQPVVTMDELQGILDRYGEAAQVSTGLFHDETVGVVTISTAEDDQELDAIRLRWNVDRVSCLKVILGDSQIIYQLTIPLEWLETIRTGAGMDENSVTD